MINNKEWNDVVRYEGLYKVNSCGKITNKNLRILNDRIKKGYNTCRLFKDGTYKENLVHRLVAQAFIPNPENKPQVNHINGIKSDNRVENLEWCTISENTSHAHKKGLIKKRYGVLNNFTILSEKQVLEIRNYPKLSPEKKKEIAITYGVSYNTISDILARRRWKHL